MSIERGGYPPREQKEIDKTQHLVHQIDQIIIKMIQKAPDTNKSILIYIQECIIRFSGLPENTAIQELHKINPEIIEELRAQLTLHPDALAFLNEAIDGYKKAKNVIPLRPPTKNKNSEVTAFISESNPHMTIGGNDVTILDPQRNEKLNQESIIQQGTKDIYEEKGGIDDADKTEISLIIDRFGPNDT
jgi:hypothetical protein